ncbi:MAG: DUF192 domain-containing protein [Pseudomonadota bacterium]
MLGSVRNAGASCCGLRSIVAIVALLTLFVALVPGASAQASAGTDTSTPAGVQIPARADQVALITRSGRHLFTVEIADDPIERSRGLMFREVLPRDHGMLFDFGGEDFRAFWMKNTPLPLDIIYVRANGRVVSIAKNTTPYSTESIPSEGEARFVLEVNAGVADDVGLAPGDLLLHKRVER